jgi:hypothetical protein
MADEPRLSHLMFSSLEKAREYFARFVDEAEEEHRK